jgi:hypothetical protein
VPRAHNTWPLNPATVRERLAQRACAGHDGTEHGGAGHDDGRLR